MRIAMFGVTGVVGSEVLKLAVARGHDAQVLARSAERVPVPGLDVVVGDALDRDAVAKTVAGCEAVFSALGGFGGGRSIDEGTTNILAAMRETGVRRFVLVQGFHVPFAGDPRNPGVRFIDLALAIRDPKLVRSGHRLGEILRATDDVDWTLLRIPMAKPAPATGHYRLGVARLGGRSRITTGDAAEAALDVLDGATYVREAPMLWSS